MLFPHAALHHTISSFSSNGVKQIGQSPSMGLRLDGGEMGEEVVGAVEDGAGGARENISRSSC